MNIAIDGNEANIEKGVGVNTYAKNILSVIKVLNDKNNEKINFTIFLKEKPHSWMPSENKYWQYKVLKGRSKWVFLTLTPYLWRNFGNFDLFFTPSHYIPPLVPIKRVCAVMDLGYLESKGQFSGYDYWQLRLWTAYSIRVSKAIITISAATESDIVRHYPKSRKNIKITHLGYDPDLYNTKLNNPEIERVKNKYNIVNEYILFLSTLKPSKNIEGLLEAWSQIENKHKNVQLVIAGKKGWLFDTIFEKSNNLNLGKRVLFTDYVNEKDKPHLIKGAKLFALPSFWEGFGLDVVSSMASGVPVVISDKGSLPEVGGKAAIYCNPDNPASIAKSIEKVLLMDKNDYNKLATKSIKQARKFSWENTANLTLETLIKTAQEK